MFSVGFLNGFGYPLAHLFRSKSWKGRGSGGLAAGMEKGSEKGVIFEWLEPRKVSSRRGESMILRVLFNSRKGLHFGVVLVSPLGAFGVS